MWTYPAPDPDPSSLPRAQHAKGALRPVSSPCPACRVKADGLHLCLTPMSLVADVMQPRTDGKETLYQRGYGVYGRKCSIAEVVGSKDKGVAGDSDVKTWTLPLLCYRTAFSLPSARPPLSTTRHVPLSACDSAGPAAIQSLLDIRSQTFWAVHADSVSGAARENRRVGRVWTRGTADVYAVTGPPPHSCVCALSGVSRRPKHGTDPDNSRSARIRGRIAPLVVCRRLTGSIPS
ncbi:hypothetical protein B0H13DRAFT_145234 [Mycena leptocephala]|nr:hypothetical protein B0H13DRAFT_145234 [Mycena leptocephala]